MLLPRPATIKPEAWRLLGIFAATIAGLILQPIPGGALVLMAVTLASIVRRSHHHAGAWPATATPPSGW